MTALENIPGWKMQGLGVWCRKDGADVTATPTASGIKFSASRPMATPVAGANGKGQGVVLRAKKNGLETTLARVRLWETQKAAMAAVDKEFPY